MHVEGDYRSPPPAGTYDRLLEHVKGHMRKPPVTLPPDLRCVVGQACLEQFAKERAAVFVLSVGGQHVHAAVDCAGDDLKQLVGRVKKVSSHRIREQIPGKVWALGSKLVTVRSEAHWAEVLTYIQDHAPNAWVWVHPNLPEARC